MLFRPDPCGALKTSGLDRQRGWTAKRTGRAANHVSLCPEKAGPGSVIDKAARDWRVQSGPGWREFSDVLAVTSAAAVGLSWTGGAGGTGNARPPRISEPPSRGSHYGRLLSVPQSCGEGWIGTGRGCTTRSRAPPPGPPTQPLLRSGAAGKARCRAGRAPSTLRPARPRILERNAPSS